MHEHRQSRGRLSSLDGLRGLAVIMMIIFHLSYDLCLFQIIGPIDFLNNPFWYWFPRLIVFLFLFCSGASLALVHGQVLRPQSFWPRLKKVTLLALAISVVTYFLFPQHWIYFGILHCIAASSFLALPFLSRPKVALFVALAILGSNLVFRALWGRYTLIPLSGWLKVESMDYEPLYPWFGVLLLGVWAGHERWLSRLSWGDSKVAQAICFLGGKSLIIYIVHQPLIYGFLWLWQWTGR